MGRLEKFDLSGYVAGQVSPTTAQERTIEIITGEILEAKRVGGEAILTIGKGLIEAKAMLPHGEWLPWLTEKVEFSKRTANRFMRLAREWTNPTALSDLGATKALILLALPPEERDAFMTENHIVGGEEKAVIDMSAREMEKAIRDREEALAEKNAAEAARAKMAEDMVMVKRLLETAQKEKEKAVQALERARDKADRAADAVVTMEKQVAELKNRPVEVAVEVDQEAVKKAQAEAVARMQEKLDKVQAEKDKLIAARDEAEEKRKSAEESLAAAQAKLDAAVKAERSSSVIGADALLAQFQICLEQAQAIVNKMQGLLIKARGRDDGSTAEKLEKALLALSEKIRRDMQ